MFGQPLSMYIIGLPFTVDHQGLTLVAAQRAARLRPDHLQLTNIRCADRLQSAVPRQCLIAAGSGPQIRIFRPIGDLVPDCRCAERTKCQTGTHGVQSSMKSHTHFS